jgi:hypothetical protein
VWSTVCSGPNRTGRRAKAAWRRFRGDPRSCRCRGPGLLSRSEITAGRGPKPHLAPLNRRGDSHATRYSVRAHVGCRDTGGQIATGHPAVPQDLQDVAGKPVLESRTGHPIRVARWLSGW